MIDTIIVSGGNIHSDFALDFLKKNEACLIAADKGLEFFLEHQLLPDAVIGDFDSLSEDGKKILEIQEERSMDSEIPYGGMTEWKLQKGFGNKIKEINDVRNNYNANKRRVLPINKLLEFLSNKDNYSNINYDPKTRIITYFNKDGLLRNLDVIDKINSNGKAYTEYWINDYIKIDIDNYKMIKLYHIVNRKKCI